MALDTLEPNPAWDAPSHEQAIETLAAHEDLVYRVWGGDWCKDCRSQLPDFGAALDAAGVPDEQIVHYELDQNKEGPGVEEYDIEYIPTVVVERDGDEIARFVEKEPVPIAVSLARCLREELDE
jgi:thiol-disulfide isomerase/thioredoxin